MSKTSRIILWCVLIAVLAMCIVLYIAAKRPIEDTAYRNAGKTYAESQQPGDETPVITGGDFTITAHTFENCARKTAPPARRRMPTGPPCSRHASLCSRSKATHRRRRRPSLRRGTRATRPMRGMIFAMRSQKQPWTRRALRSPRRTLGRSRATITTPPVHGRS